MGRGAPGRGHLRLRADSRQFPVRRGHRGGHRQDPGRDRVRPGRAEQVLVQLVAERIDEDLGDARGQREIAVIDAIPG